MDRKSIGRAIGLASLAIGTVDLVMGRRLGRSVGAGEQMGGRLFHIVGVRELATGIAGLIAPGSAEPVKWRLAGDIVDLAALAYIAAPANPRRKAALATLGLVAAIAAVDLLASRTLEKD